MRKRGFGDAARTHIKEVFAFNEYGKRKPDNNFKQTLKGKLCEDESCELLDSVFPVGFIRFNNTRKFKSDYFTGEPDIILPDEKLIEDIKNPYEFYGFLGKPKDYDELLDSKDRDFVFQLHTYGYNHMYETGQDIEKLAVCYTGNDTPYEVLQKFEFGGLISTHGYDTKEYYEAKEELINLHTFTDVLTPEERIIRIEFDYQQSLVDKMIDVMETKGRPFYETLK